MGSEKGVSSVERDDGASLEDHLALVEQQKEAFRASQQTDGQSGTWFDPQAWSTNSVRMEYMELVAELVPEAIEDLHERAWPSYKRLFDRGVLTTRPWDHLAVRGCSRMAMQRMAERPWSVIPEFLIVDDAAGRELVDAFLGKFEEWCWRYGMLDAWTWNIVLETLLRWSTTEPPREGAAPRDWAMAYLGSHQTREFQMPAWQPLLMEREQYISMVNQALDRAEQALRQEGFRERPRKRESGADADDRDRHLRWLVQWQAGGVLQKDLGERRTVQDALTRLSGHIGLTRRSTAGGRKRWSLRSAVAQWLAPGP